jgi:beta-glucosidase
MHRWLTPSDYIGNEQETQRNPSTSGSLTIEAVSSNIDDRTLHELYLWPFADAVRAGVSAIMCSYNRVNESYSCQNSKLLNGVLKEELGFQGYVMSDWGATHAGVATVEAGLDMDMPGTIGFFVANQSYFGGNLTASVNNGSISEERLDDMARRVMTPYFHLQQNVDYPPTDSETSAVNVLQLQPVSTAYNYGPSNVDVRDDHAQLIRDLGAAGAVLLKNTNNALPLRAPKNIGVFGNDAGEPTDGLYGINNANGFEFGTLPVGGGSG